MHQWMFGQKKETALSVRTVKEFHTEIERFTQPWKDCRCEGQ